MSCAVVSARSAGLDRSRSGLTSRLAKRLPIVGASRFPRSSSGRSRSGNDGSSRLDLACRTRNNVFMAHPSPMASATTWQSCTSGTVTAHDTPRWLRNVTPCLVGGEHDNLAPLAGRSAATPASVAGELECSSKGGPCSMEPGPPASGSAVCRLTRAARLGAAGAWRGLLAAAGGADG